MKTVKVLMRFPSDRTGEPVAYSLVKNFGLSFNILQAHINPGMTGELTLELMGDEDAISRGVDYLKAEGIDVILPDAIIVWDSKRCIDCGVCTAVCPTAALCLDENDKLSFSNEKCIVCELCVSTCPLGVIETAIDSGA